MNYNKVIKDLKERNDKLESQRRQFESKLYHEQHIVEQKDKEIKRLNNIINELENYINNQDYWLCELGYKEFTPYISVKKIQDKLKELKEGKNQKGVINGKSNEC